MFGLMCPICGSWYTDDKESPIWYEIGEVCGNRTGSGPYPADCPCPGILELAKAVKRKKKREEDSDYD